MRIVPYEWGHFRTPAFIISNISRLRCLDHDIIIDIILHRRNNLIPQIVSVFADQLPVIIGDGLRIRVIDLKVGLIVDDSVSFDNDKILVPAIKNPCMKIRVRCKGD